MWALKSIFIVAFLAYKVSALVNPEEVFAWKQLTFAWPSDAARDAAIKDGVYVPENNLLLGLGRWKNKMFVTIPRWKTGVPTSLGYVSVDETINKTASIIPYPDWETNALPKGNVTSEGIVSVFRLAVDACDRLWLMDAGVNDVLGATQVISPPSILIYDLNTDKLLKRYTFTTEDQKQDSFFANIVVDVNKDKCNEAFAYVPDLGANGIVVYSLEDNDSWRFTHNFFHMDPLNGDFNISGINFQWTDGVFGLALGTPAANGFRTVYFHPLASLNEFSVNSAVLRNKTLASDSHIYYLFKLEGCKGKKTQTSVAVFDEKSNSVFLSQIHRDGVACWNPRRKLRPWNFVLFAQDSQRLIFVNDMKIDDDRNLWILSDKLPKFQFQGLDPNEINYRILKVKVDDAIAGTRCVA